MIIATGAGVGITGAWLDVLVKWWAIGFIHLCHINIDFGRNCRLGDIREGRCSYGIFYNQVACCSGLDCKLSLLVIVLLSQRRFSERDM